MRILLSAIFLCLMTFGVQAQKFGHINSQLLLLESPDIKAANTELENLQQELVKKGEVMVKDFETKYQAYVNEANAGTLSQVQAQQKESVLAQAQQEIQQYEVQIQQQILERREQLYKPILDKIKNELDAYAKENGYTMVFDSSAGSILYAPPGDDLLQTMKTRLGF